MGLAWALGFAGSQKKADSALRALTAAEILLNGILPVLIQRGAAPGQAGIDHHGEHFRRKADRHGERKQNAEPQFPLVSPQAIKATGMRTAINRISAQAMELAPRSNPFLRQTEVTVKPP